MGGTGTGTGLSFSQQLSVVFGKKLKMQVKVVPPPNNLGNDPIASYNTICGLNIEHSDADLWFDNDCLYRFCEQ